ASPAEASAAATDLDRLGPPVTTSTSSNSAASFTACAISLSKPGGAATTIRSTLAAALSEAAHQVTSGRPASRTSAFGVEPPKRGPPGAVGGNHDRHVVVENLDRQVLPYLPQYFLLLLLEDLPSAVMGVDHLVPYLVIDRRAVNDDYLVLLVQCW